MAHRENPAAPGTARRALPLIVCALLAACASNRPVPTQVAVDRQSHVPDFARRPFAPFSRIDAVAIALREWRAFGQAVDDLPPGSRPDLGEAKPERQPGLWQRVGEYWWLGQDSDNPFNGVTGKHDSFGYVFAPAADETYAWSAAFISYIMRTAGAGTRFPYAPSHFTYINAAARHDQGLALTAERPDSYAPQPGDVICAGRGTAKTLRFENLPAGAFASHCDIVIGANADGLSVIGGNVDDNVTLKHIPIDGAGRIAAPGNLVYDQRYPWIVVLRVLYDQ
jgi:hypothetical protein